MRVLSLRREPVLIAICYYSSPVQTHRIFSYCCAFFCVDVARCCFNRRWRKKRDLWSLSSMYKTWRVIAIVSETHGESSSSMSRQRRERQATKTKIDCDKWIFRRLFVCLFLQKIFLTPSHRSYVSMTICGHRQKLPPSEWHLPLFANFFVDIYWCT